MDKELDILKTIQRVEAPEGLYDSIRIATEQGEGKIISMTWVRTAAAVFILFLSAEVYLSLRTQAAESSNAPVTFFSVDGKQLYHE